MPIFANIIQDAFSPLINVFESIMVFMHENLVGGSWGLAIIGLTVLIRAILVPLTYRQLKSMQEMQRLAPQMNEIKEKYKEDKQRQQQEIMKFYQENKINPLASCLPLLLQLPVFISLFYMLRTDLKLDICGPEMRRFYTRELHKPIVSNSQIPQNAVKVAGHTVKGLSEVGCNVVAPGSAKFLFIPDITAKATGIVLVVLILFYVGSQLASTLIATATADPNQRRLMLLLPVVFVVILYRYPAGLLVYWITTNLWTVGQQSLIRRHIGPAPPRVATPKGSATNGKPQRAGQAGAGRRQRGGGGCERWEPAGLLAPAPGGTQKEEALGQAAMSDTDELGAEGEELEPAEALGELLEEIVEDLGLDAEVEVEVDAEVLHGRLKGEDVGLFIGRHGQTIDAVQHLAQRIVFPEGPAPVRVVIDANGYRERRADALRAEADDAADEAVRLGRSVDLDPLPPFERRLVHEYLRDRDEVETHSEGDEPERYLVVSPRDGGERAERFT